MRKSLLVIAALAIGALAANAQTPRPTPKEGVYEFTVTKAIPATSVKNQSSSGTCWSFAATGFLESELLKNGKGEYDLSEMWAARWSYYDKAVKYVRMHGTINFGGGGATHDVFNVWRQYGYVPEEVYPGLNYGSEVHRHGEIDAVLKAYVDVIIKQRQPSTAWLAGLNGILDAYFGAVPETFEYKGVSYTPKSFAESTGLNMDDFVTFTSYTHHPFYEQFVLEIPDNWAWGLSYNVPVEDMMNTVDYALENGYTVNWGADVSETGFTRANGTAFAIIPPFMKEDKSDSEEAKWVKLSDADRASFIGTMTEPVDPVEITQQMRQEAFDNYQTTDDHGMLITGTATDQKGNKFYQVKNSWGTVYGQEGYLFASYPFVAYKTMNITVNKNAIPKELRKKLGIK